MMMNVEHKTTTENPSLEIGTMLPMLTRHKVQVLIDAGHTQHEVAEITGIGLRTVKRAVNKRDLV